MYRTLLLAAGITAILGCARSPGDSPDRSTGERTSETSAAVTLDELWSAYQVDAAAAVRKYGNEPAIKFTAEKVTKNVTGFVVTVEPGGRTQHHLYFKEDSASWLEAGRTYSKRGKVKYTLPRGLEIYCD